MGEKKFSLKDFKIYGAPWYMALMCSAIILVSAYIGVLGYDFSSIMGLIIAYGIIFFEIGERLPIWNTYIGGGVLAAFFGTAIMRQLNMVPTDYLAPIDEFISGDTVGFMTFWIIIFEQNRCAIACQSYA